MTTTLILAVFGAGAALSGSVLADFKPFGMTLFDLYDFSSSNILAAAGRAVHLPVRGLALGLGEVRRRLNNDGRLRNDRIVQLFFGVVKFLTPILVFIVLLNGLGVIKL